MDRTEEIKSITEIAKKIVRIQNQTTRQLSGENLSEEEVVIHKKLLVHVGNMLLSSQEKTIVIDENYKPILGKLIYYFNNVSAKEDLEDNKVIEKGNNIMLCGNAGTGKTFTMLLFAEYLKRVGHKDVFVNVSVTQLINYYKINGHIDKFTYNELEGAKNVKRSFDGNPYNICIHDIGVETVKHFGVETKEIVKEFLFARYEIFTQYGKKTHITTNLSPKDLSELFDDDHKRLNDRFKTYNIIPMQGESRR